MCQTSGVVVGLPRAEAGFVRTRKVFRSEGCLRLPLGESRQYYNLSYVAMVLLIGMPAGLGLPATVIDP
jgi:hypothetical protein